VRSIKASVNVDLTLLVIEVIVFLIPRWSGLPRTAGSGNSPTYTSHPVVPCIGFAGVGLGVVFGILSFIGSRCATPRGRNEERAGASCSSMARWCQLADFYVLMMYLLAAGYGLQSTRRRWLRSWKDSERFVTLRQRHALVAATHQRASPHLQLLPRHSQHHRSRMFSMGRDQVLPASLGRIHQTWYSPIRAIIAQSIFTVESASASGSGSAWCDWRLRFTGTIGTVAIVIAHIRSNIALVKYFWKPRRSAVTHVTPVLGVPALPNRST
jgi:amino acid transporter